MELHLLCQTPHLRVYEDRTHDWLYLEWEGELTLPDVQHACLAVAECFLGHLHPRVLNVNTLVTHADWDVAPWLAQQLLPALELAGVAQLAWVHAPSIQGLDLVVTATQQLLGLRVAIFADLEDAVSWLQRTGPAEPPATGCALGRPLATEQKLAHVVGKFARQLAGATAPVAAN